MKKYQFIGIICLVIIVAGCTGTSSIMSSSNKADKIMENLDANNDQKISKSEIKFPLNEDKFNAADTNNDGFLSKAEVEKYMSEN